MIRQELDIDGYWRVTVFYLPDVGDMAEVIGELRAVGCPASEVRKILRLFPHRRNKGVTFPGFYYRHSVTVIGKATSWSQFFDSVLHEVDHLVDVITEYYHVSNHREPPAYLQGEIGRQMAPAIRRIACPCCGIENDQSV